MKRFESPNLASPARPYSPGIQVGPWCYLSGKVPISAAGKLVGTTAFDQTLAVLHNLETTLSAVGGTRSDIVSTSVFLTQIADIDEVDRAYREFFQEGCYPTRTTVQIAALGRPEFLVEISGIAALQAGG